MLGPSLFFRLSSFWECLHFSVYLHFWIYVIFRCYLQFWGHFHFWGHLLNLFMFVVQRATAPKKGVEVYCCCRRTCKGVPFSANQRSRNLLIRYRQNRCRPALVFSLGVARLRPSWTRVYIIRYRKYIFPYSTWDLIKSPPGYI